MTEGSARIAALAARYAAAFPEETPGWRRVGREAEYPVVTADGAAADLQGVFARLAALPDHGPLREGDLWVGATGPVPYLLEVGRGTIELVLPPADDLVTLRAVHRAAVGRLVAAATAEGLRVLGFGIQPLTPATDQLMAPKQRYGVMLRRMGPGWLGFTTTASDQVHVDVGRDEVIAVTNLVNLLAPVTLALCGNSSVRDGAAAEIVGREPMLAGVFPEDHRSGMLPRPVRDLNGWVSRLARLPYLQVRTPTGAQALDVPFAEWLDRNPDPDAGWAGLQHHERYIWNSGRPRSLIATVEVRAACQQPWADHDAAAALGLGMVQAWPEIDALLRTRLGHDPWPAMRAWHPAAVALGLDAPEPAPGLLLELLERVTVALARRGRGEEALISPLFARLEAKANPGQVARDVFLAGGLPALIDHLALPESLAC